MQTKNFTFLLLSVLIIATVGCSDKVPMRGKVTFSDDGAPLTAGQVTFQSDTILARGYLKPDGTYILGTDKETDGIPKGTYNVYLLHTTVYETPPGGGSPIEKQQVSRKYASGETSELTCTVNGKTVFDFTVEKP